MAEKSVLRNPNRGVHSLGGVQQFTNRGPDQQQNSDVSEMNHLGRFCLFLHSHHKDKLWQDSSFQPPLRNVLHTQIYCCSTSSRSSGLAFDPRAVKARQRVNNACLSTMRLILYDSAGTKWISAGTFRNKGHEMVSHSRVMPRKMSSWWQKLSGKCQLLFKLCQN